MRMAPVCVLRRPSQVAAMEHPLLSSAEPTEYNDGDYSREVLQFEGGETEAIFDENLAREAESLGIAISRPPTPPRMDLNGHYSLTESAATVATHHARTASSASQESVSTGMTSRSSNEQLDASQTQRKRPVSRSSLSFSDYERYLATQAKQDMAKSNFHPPSSIPQGPAPSLFSVSTRRSYISLKNGIKSRFKLRKSRMSQEELISCICCRDDFKMGRSLHTLPCGHNYCSLCLRVLVTQAANEEAKMPPRCCTQPLPGAVIKSILDKEEQQLFMRSVLQFSTPWEARIFCPNTACSEFIPKRSKIDPKHPFEVICWSCRTRACSTCKRAAHAFGQDCPSDWELEAVLQMGEKSGWRRCYKCRNLVELTQGCSHITCRCKAQFCYICGAVWDLNVGCPNYCNGEEELERRRLEEEARVAEEEAEKAAQEENEKAEAAEKVESERRTANSMELSALRARQINERDRFSAFERKQKWIMWTRHGQAKLNLLERYEDLLEKMKDRHARTAAHLEDRQVAAEMELRESQEQAERSVRIRLRHMEAYCDGLGLNSSGTNPARVVTERDLRELGQAYNVRDDMDRLHQSKVNVLRDKQAKQMEQLMNRQDAEMKKLAGKQSQEEEGLERISAKEEGAIAQLFLSRRQRLSERWRIVEEIGRKKLEQREGIKFAPMPPIRWAEEQQRDEGLAGISE